jgi:hypothetical protein
MRGRKILKRLGWTIFSLFALIGVLFTGVFAAMQFGLLNVRGSIAERNQFFGPVAKIVRTDSCVQSNSDGSSSGSCQWNQSEEWVVVRDGLQKDQTLINQVASQTSVSPRMIASAVAPEQLRFFTSDRETFKKYFEPLKILGSLSKFSLGVSGIKQTTANKIEQYAVDSGSPFYPGKGYDQLISYPAGSAHAKLQYDRLTDSKNHYYAYLYTALYIKEIESQWQKAGYDITSRPDILVTLFNIGFSQSKPKDTPQIGGSPITVGDKIYSFGDIGSRFYQSDELVKEFPRT